jgi:Ca2+-binding RTX toxin-like protein
MPTLEPVRYAAGASRADTSRITDLAIIPRADGTDILYATTRHDGEIIVWSLTGNGLTRIDTAAHGRPDRAGSVAVLGELQTTDGPAILTGGGATGSLTLRPIEDDGQIGPARTLGTLGNVPGDLVDPETVRLTNGNSVVYAGTGSNSGIIRAYFRPDGDLVNAFRVGDSATTYAEQVTALTQARMGDVTYIIGASSLSNGLTAWAVAPLSGALTAVDSLDGTQGLWINAPTAMETATIAGRTYLVLAAAGTGSLSVIEIGTGGRLTPVTHLLDDLATRFAGVSAMDVLSHGGLTYVIAGGADDGISVLVLLPGGQLVAEAHLADTTATGLTSISAITARSHGTGIDIFVASATETGLTRLRFDTGADGSRLVAVATGSTLTGGAGRDLLQGAAGADRLSGGAGDDILTDGRGSDRLTGGAGADLFVLSADDVTDTITDFTPGTDRVNLSAWPMLRSLDQLTMTTTATGMRITYGQEVLILTSADGRPIPLSALSHADLIGGTSIPQDIRPGFPGPTRPAPDLPARDYDGPPRPRPLPVDPLPEPANPWPFPWDDAGPTTGSRIRGTARDDVLRGNDRANTIIGLGGDDRLSGGPGRDLLRGDSDRDLLDGGRGNDRLYGGTGRDTLVGQSGDDRLFGGSGNDRLEGWGENDLLAGRRGDDVLFGLGNNDRLYGGSGEDRLNGGTGADLVLGDAGRDILAGMDGADRLNGGSGADRISGNAGNDRLGGAGSNDVLHGGGGNDRLAGGTGDDRLTGGTGADVFVFASGADRITDLGRGDSILIDDALWVQTLSVGRMIDRFADLVRGDAILAFGDGDRLVIEDIRSLDALARRIDLF